MSCSSEIYKLDTSALRDEIGLTLTAFFKHGFATQENIFGLQVSVSVSGSMHKGNGFKELPCERLKVTRRKTEVVVLFDYIVEGGTQLFEDKTVVAIVVEALNISYQVVLVLGVSTAQVFDDWTLGLRRVNVLLHWLYHLTCLIFTFIAKKRPSYRPSTTRPKVPVPSKRVTLYLCPSFSPTLYWKCGVFLRFLVSGDTELLKAEFEREEDEDEL